MRTVLKTFRAHEAPVGDLSVLRALPQPGRRHIGPFVFLDHFGPLTVKEGPGIPAHPHAGIEVITYLLEGSQVHRDSLGNENRVGAGGAQWITAGRGIIHAEKPEVGSRLHGVQIWSSLPRAQKLIEPAYQGIQADEVPQVPVGQAQVRVLAGSLGGVTGPIRLAQPALLLHVRAEAATELPVPEAFELGIYSLSGTLDVLSAGDTLSINAGDWIVLGGEPAEGPLLFGGPFVMDTKERLFQAEADYFAGRMGTLDGVPG
jgi:redox-sensitive bicupin YhaK (pirin superfamily)